MKIEMMHSTMLGHYLVQPIADLLHLLQHRDDEHIHTPRALEISYCVTLIPELLRLLQSYAGSLHEMLGNQPEEMRPEEALRTYCSDDALAGQVEEIRCLRDAIEHTHIWRRQMNWTLISRDPYRSEVECTDFELQQGLGRPRFGDERFRRVVDLRTGRTRQLGLNAIPTEFVAADMVTILTVFSSALEALEQVVRSRVATDRFHPFYPSEARVAHGFTPSVTFREAIDRFIAAERQRA